MFQAIPRRYTQICSPPELFFGRLSLIYCSYLIHIYFTSPALSIYLSGPHSVPVQLQTTQFHLWGIDYPISPQLFVYWWLRKNLLQADIYWF